LKKGKGKMKVTVCELPNEPAALEKAWIELVHHVKINESEFVLLPEMPFHPWLAHTQDVDAAQWDQAVQAHEAWLSRLDELGPATVAGTRPVVLGGKRQNAAYIWEPGKGVTTVHTKYYLPNEPGFWEASWYERGDGDFSLANTSKGKAGFLICTEIWFNFHAREYGKGGAQLLLCPRATPNPTAPKWVAGGQAAAVVSGAFCLSSNLAGATPQGGDYAGVGWIIEPGEGKVLGLTSLIEPFLTMDIDLEEADRAKGTYPRYVLD
jgi:N-carbamoylputrescine amidase